ncbi:MAG: SDR family oxidoreductase [Phycisphaerae bacterium]
MSHETSVALITGAARRVGRAIALELARAGCDIAVHFNRSEDQARSLAEEIRRLNRRSHLIQADLNLPDSWPGIVHQAVEALGTVDILVNNAAVFHEMDLADFELEQWDHVFRVNVTAAAALCRHAWPHLRRRGCGKIINLADISANQPWSTHLAYCASKAALVSLTRALAKSLAPDVCVNAVSPGIAVFPEAYGADTRAKLISQVPLRRPGTSEDVAKTVRFLCIEAGYITGQVINVDGGRSIV